MLDLLERVSFVVAFSAILLTSAVVSFFSFVLPKESGISIEECRATDLCLQWLAGSRQLAHPVPVLLLGPAVAGPEPTVSVEDVAREGEAIPLERQVPGVPWLLRHEGVVSMQPRAIPQIIHDKLQGFDDAFAEAQQASGEFQDGRYRLTWVEPSSLLGTTLGLREGDEIVSVNGHPVGQTFAAARGLYDMLRSQKRFAVRLRRGGQDVMLSFHVD